MADTQYDVLIRFITEMVGEEAAQKAASSVGDLTKKVQQSEKSLQSSKKLLKEWTRELVDMRQKLKGLTQGSSEFNDLKKNIDTANAGIIYQKRVVEDATQAHKQLTAQLKQETSAQSSLQAQARKTAEILNTTSATLNRIGNTLVLGGTAITGGIFKAASDFISKSGEQSALTQEWKASTEEIAHSYERIGRVATQELLPFMQTAAKIASQIASIVERHPELIKGAAEIGVAALTVGTAAKVAAGISGVAGQLLALAGKIGVTGLGTAGATGAAGGTAGGAGLASIGAPIAIVAAPIIAAILTKEIGNEIQKALGMQESSWQDIATTMTQAIQLPSKSLILVLRELGVVTAETAKKISDAISGYAMGATGLRGQAGGSLGAQGSVSFTNPGFSGKEAVDAFIQMREAEIQAEKNFQSQRQSIIQDANNAILNSTRNNAKAIASINARASENRGKIIADFTAASNDAEQRYAQQRAQIVRDGNIEIQRIEQQRIENLRKLELEHNDRVSDLVANRDALGLVLEQRKFDRQREELDRQTNMEIAQRRQDLAIRLQDAAQAFMQERAQRQAQFIAQLKENELQRQAAIKQQQEQHAEEMRQIERQRVQKLRELQIQHSEEMSRIRQSFIAKIRDLNASLLGEQQSRRRYYALMQRDLEAYLAQYRATASRLGSTAGTGTVPRYAAGGYTPTGLIYSHSGEFVTNRATTNMLESVVGGRLTQQNMYALAARAAAPSSVVWNDGRRFSGEYTMSMRRANRRDTIDILSKVIKKR